MGAFTSKEIENFLNGDMEGTSRYYIKQNMIKLQKYEELETQLQAVAKLNLKQLIEIARTCTVYIDINGDKHSLYAVADAMKKTGLPFLDIYHTLFKPSLNGKTASESIYEVLNRLSLEWKDLK